MSIDDLKHAQRERILYLDACLTWRGQANRSDLIDQFDISTAQAALDFRSYLSLCVVPPVYDPSRKTYFAQPGHAPLVHLNTAEVFAMLDNSASDSHVSIPLPRRRMDQDVVAALYRAIQSESDVLMSYTSMISGSTEPQWIAPTRFHFDGDAIHLRAWSYLHGAYRDYLPIRFEKSETYEVRRRDIPLPPDVSWHQRVRLHLRPRACLDPAQQRVVRMEYGFETSAHLIIETRKALIFYIKARWRLDDESGRLELDRVEDMD